MWVRSYLHVLLIIITNVYQALCQEKSSLTFVIDDTASMHDDISQVKVSADGITKIVFDEKASQIKNMVLVTFNDPGVRLMTVTEDRNIFKHNINSLKVYGGYDCPEMSMSGILEALNASLPGSFIYVFTDASAADYFRSNEVKNICQKKQSQIVFVLTGFCINREDPQYQVYYDIAHACGLAFDVGRKDVNKILSTIKETIIGKQAVITTKKVPAYTSSDIPFEIDDQTEYAIVTASGLNVNLKIIGPSAETSYLTWLPNVKVIKINRPTSGSYIARVWGKSQTSVYVVGRTDFTFTHGFSKMEPKSLKDTTPQPIANTPTLLSISVADPKHTVDILLVHILNMDEQIINSLLLRQVSKDFYTTSIPFKAPSKRFKIAVIGREVRTGKSIRRLAKLPITPQEPPKVEPKVQKPELTISEGNVIKVKYGQTVKLTCKATAYPEPNIEWFNRNRVPLKSQSSAVEPPFKYISYLTIVDISESEKYSCHAKNKAGDTTTAIEVIVEDPFDVKSAIEGITTIEYGAKGTLRCDITTSVPMHITWDYLEENTGVRKQIVPSNSHSISADGSVLTINKMDFDMVGTYRCKAVLDKNLQKTSVHQTRVKISGLSHSEAKGQDNISVLKGSNVDITCQITGTPKPTITWLFKAKDATDFASIHGSSNVLQIFNIDVHQAGSYKCKAHNIIGDSEHVTTLSVQIPPNIISSSTNVYKSIEGYDATLKIPCVATGLPRPIVTWMVNGISLSENAKYSITNNGTLVIRDPKVSDNNKYRCEAKNDAGSTHVWFQVYVRQLPAISGVASITVKTDEPVNIPCKVIKGVPKPTITWHFMAKDSSEFVRLPTSTEGLRITKAARHNTGAYKCIASNEVGNDEHSTDLTVEFAPIILSDHSEPLIGLEGDVAFHIPCITIGEPKPSVTWRMNKDVITANEHYLVTDKALIIKNPTKEDSNSYTCEAKNYLGRQQATFNAIVETSLENFGPIQTVHIKRGDTTKLECGFGDPSQYVRWFMEGVDQGIKGNYFDLANVDVSLDGNYTCHVSDINGTFTKTYRVIIGYPPIFTSEANPLMDWSGAEYDVLDCNVEAKPEPDIIWTFNGKVLSHSRSASLSVSGNWGHYTCSVKNVHGEVQRSFDVTSSKCLISRQPTNIRNMPLILTPTATWPILDFTTDYLKVQPGQTVMFSCPNANDTINSFQKLPGLNETEAICDKEDIFKVGDKSYKVSDLQCAQEGSSVVNKRHLKCSSENSELIRVGFEVHDFLETYEVCFDTYNKVPLYTRVTMSRSNQGPGNTYHWYQHPEIVGGNKEAVYTCKDSMSTCCYSKTQLVNTRDFSDGPAQKSTFIDPLNAIPYWRPCDIQQSPWHSIEDDVRSRLSIYKELEVWSGTYILQNKNGGVIPRYLWKVIVDDDDQIAIIYINDPLPSKADILCTNTCPDENSVPWIHQNSTYTYCCNVEDFLEAFNLSETSIGKPMA